MAEVRFLLNEHIPKAVVRALRQQGIDAIIVAEIEAMGTSDEDLLDFALREGRVVVTYDKDFLRLASQRSHAGIAFSARRLTDRQLIRALRLLHGAVSAEEMTNHVEHLSSLI